MDDPQSTLNTPTPTVVKSPRRGMITAIVVLCILVVILAGWVVWLITRSSSSGTSVSTPTTKTTTNATTTTKTLKAITVVAKSGTKFSVSYPDTWALSIDGYTTLTRTSSTGEQTAINISSSIPQSGGCLMLTSGWVIPYYDTAPIAGWTGNSYAGFYETYGDKTATTNTACFFAGMVATKDATFTTGKTADQLYLQGATSHPSIDTSASSGDQLYVTANRQFTSEDQVTQFVASDEYNELKAIIQSLSVVK